MLRLFLVILAVVVNVPLALGGGASAADLAARVEADSESAVVLHVHDLGGV